MKAQKMFWVSLALIPGLILAFCIIRASRAASPQAQISQTPTGTSFSYQARLSDAGNPATGSYDFEFKLYDTLTGGVQVGGLVDLLDVPVKNGLFTVFLDFGNVFNGNSMFLETSIRPGGSLGSYTTLVPRQPLTAVPYASYAIQSGGGGGWLLSGNSGTDPAVNFLGTIDPITLTLKVGGMSALRLAPGSSSPNVIGGFGLNSVATGINGAVIGGGGSASLPNSVSGDFGVVSGGIGNSTTGVEATVSGGWANTAGNYATIGGGSNNNAAGSESTVAGGGYNSASNSIATVGGGALNVASGYISTIGGGNKNSADGDYSTIAGGVENNTSAVYSTAAGGYQNNITGDYASIGGGSGNAASGLYAVIGGGGGTFSGAVPNQATADWSTVGGGRSNTASGPAATVGGGDGNTASGLTATIPGGSGNTASGAYSFAAGAVASATDGGSFVWSSYDPTVSWGVDTFTARAHGGVRFYSGTGTSTGVELSTGANSWSSISDRNVKENFSVVDDQMLLEQLAAMPIQTWNLKSQSANMRHIGPVAQDFNGLLSSLFGTVEDPLRINNMDAIGVSLAAIQGVYQQNLALRDENAALKKQLDDLNQRVSALENGKVSTNAVLSLVKALFPWAISLCLGFAWLSRRKGDQGEHASGQ